jgi:hypothetical protein
MFVRCRGSHIFYTVGSHIAVRFVSLTRRPAAIYAPGRFLILISVGS